MTYDIKLATETDASGVLTIYAPFVRETAITFDVTIPSENELRERLKAVLSRTPWLVCTIEGTIAGYAYAGSHNPREAYQWSADCSVYVHAEHRSHGIGRALYTALFSCLRAQGFYNVYAGITLPNAASVALHEAMGFRLVGIYESVGHKLGAWHDVGWWHLALRPHDDSPTAPQPLQAVLGTQVWENALTEGRRLLPGNKG
jgi:L-amino acid N-acyltransferase YncA